MKIIAIKSEEEEFIFRSNNDYTEYHNQSLTDNVIIPNLKPVSKNISLQIVDFMTQN